jgi:tellurite resistance protein TerC
VNVPWWAWLATVAGLLALVARDLLVVDRTPHQVTMAEAGRRVAFYVACAVGFGALVWVFFGAGHAGEYFAGYLTEYSLSVDNLFVFLLIVSSFKVPAIHQHRVLLFGIVLALALRAVLIIAGAALVSRYTAVFYLFGLFLVIAAARVWRGAGESEDEFRENLVLRSLRRVLPVTEDYVEGRSFVRTVGAAGRLMVTPMLVVMVAIGTTDLLFALDSIPAVLGLTQQPFLVFAVNAFALMGLRQLYFLVGGVLNRLVCLPYGLAVLLAFIGCKLILDVLADDWNPFKAGRQVIVGIPVFGPASSLVVIAVVLAGTVMASLVVQRRAR